jgi:hypothetical protein
VSGFAFDFTEKRVLLVLQMSSLPYLLFILAAMVRTHARASMERLSVIMLATARDVVPVSVEGAPLYPKLFRVASGKFQD